MAKTKVDKKIEKVVKKETEMDKIRKMDEATILENILDAKRELFNLRFQAALGKLEQTDRISKAKKSIARMKTVLTERASEAK